MDLLLGLCLGLGLAAACGFRVFVPLLALAVASKAGAVPLADDFAWLATWPGITTLTVATLLEIGGYYIPWLDNALDSLATPAAVTAGVVATAAGLTDTDPLLRWGAAVIGGGGIAGTVQAGSVLTRAASTLTTGGLGNAALATGEWICSLLLSLLALLLPLAAGIAAVALTVTAVRWLIRRRRRVPTHRSLP